MDTNSLILTTLSIFVLLLLIWNIRTEIRLRKVFGGKHAQELESLLKSLQSGILHVDRTNKELLEQLKDIESRMKHTIRNIQTIRFNPFVDSGSNQSFATAFLDDEGDGVILSSLYSRERVSIFAKPIIKGISSYELTEEEKEVLKKSKVN